MAFRKIIKYPDLKLKEVSSPVVDFGEDLQNLVRDLWDTLNVASGAGLSAPQIGYHERVIYISCGGFHGEMINPMITKSGDLTGMPEGCLSFPGVWETIARYNEITVEYFDRNGEKHVEDLSGVAAQAVQHEVEHLDGKLMIDHLHPLKRQRALKTVKKVTAKVSGIMSGEPKQKEPRRVKKNSHLSKKELKKRKQNRYRARKKR